MRDAAGAFVAFRALGCIEMRSASMPILRRGSLAKRIWVAVLGGAVLLVGLAMMVLPGPALIVIPAGLAILATEFEWAHRWRERARRMGRNAADRYRAHRAKNHPPPR
jgi:hypothetical protein